MIFHEIYGLYYRSVEKILQAILERRRSGEPSLSEKEARKLIDETAFSESSIAILSAIEQEEWQIIRKDMSSPIRHLPSRPRTLLERRWLQVIAGDEKMRLFGEMPLVSEEDPPLYRREDLFRIDRPSDGDDFSDPGYMEVFQALLCAVKEEKLVQITFLSAKGFRKKGLFFPGKLEYSAKDEKFRLIAKRSSAYGVISDVIVTINLARILSVTVMEEITPEFLMGDLRFEEPKESVLLRLYDRRNALERALLHFADFEKETEQIEGLLYEMKLRFASKDESEILIRLLSFGPMIEVIEPESFREKIRQRLQRQAELWGRRC